MRQTDLPLALAGSVFVLVFTTIEWKTMNFKSSTKSQTSNRLVIVSSMFEGKAQPARHRLIYGLFKEEMAAPGGIHAVQLRTLTPEEENRSKSASSELNRAVEARTD